MSHGSRTPVGAGGRWLAPSLFRVEAVDMARMRVRGELRWVTWGTAHALTLSEGHARLRQAQERPLWARLVRERDGAVVAGEGAGESAGGTPAPPRRLGLPLVRLGPGGEFVREIGTGH